MATEVVTVFELAEFAEAWPTQTERENSLLGEIDAAFLFILGGVSERIVADEIQNCRDAAIDVSRSSRMCLRNFCASAVHCAAVAGTTGLAMCFIM